MRKHFLLALMATLLPFVAWADELTVELAQKPIIYTGEIQNPVTVKKDGETLEALEADDDDGNGYTIEYSWIENGQTVTSNKGVLNAGEYTATVTGKGTYNGDAGTLEFKVEKAELTVTTSALNKIYGTPDDEVEMDYAVSGFRGNDNRYNVEIKGLKFERLAIAGNDGEDVGSYQIALTQGATADNYNIKVTGTSMLRIYPKELNVTFSGLEWTYGETEEKYGLITVTGNKEDYVYEDNDETVGLSWKLNPEVDVHNAGSYSVVPTIKSGNYTLVDPNAAIEIAKAPLTVTGQNIKKTYGMNDPAFDTENVEGWLYDDKETCKVTLTRTDKGEDVGEYTIDGCTVSNTDNYEIEYNGATYKLTIEPKNLADKDIAIAVADKEYQGQQANFSLSEITVTYGDKEIDTNKDLTVNTDYEFTYTAAKDAGKTVTVTVTAKDKGNYTGTAEYEFEIEKASLKLTAGEMTIAFNANTTNLENILETLKDCEVTDETLKAGDTVEGLDIEFSLAKNEPISIGEHDIIIKATSALADNYIIEYENGTLTITSTATQITIGRNTPNTAQLLEAYNGYTAENGGFTVIVEEERTLNANQWYTMVLPFDISARDFASVAGYAVIDTPDEGNTDAGTISFKLNMGTIAANTPFLFKIDQERNLKSTPLKFKLQGSTGIIGDGNVVINYDAEPAVEDLGGNIYHGVYANKEISENGLWYLSSGKFYNAGAVYEQYQQAVTIYTLGGYVETASKANNIRILIEEADGSVTAIDAVTGNTIYDSESWYTINGVKLNAAPTEKGIYINNGKKVFIK